MMPQRQVTEKPRCGMRYHVGMVGATEMEVAGRLFLGALLGGGIGLERQVHGRPAGFRTHLLVCVASVLLMTVSQSLGGEASRFDPGRLAAGAITGIGFLGAGVVLKAGLSVHGLTTAACLWIVSAIGLAVGSGLYFAASLSFVITLVSLWLLRYVEERLPRLAYKHVDIVVDRDVPEEQLRAVVTAHGPRITETDYELDAVSGQMTYHVTIASEHNISEREIVDALGRLPAVHQVRVRS
jgi:putative Mg2+ transporter-C (MgtC) family protein